MSRHSKLRVHDILDAIDRNIEIIGEATRSLEEPFRDKHPQIAWGEIIGMRNVMIHQYFGILPDVVWDVIQNELPSLNIQLNKLAADLIS